jgi:hypothetical protein
MKNETVSRERRFTDFPVFIGHDKSSTTPFSYAKGMPRAEKQESRGRSDKNPLQISTWRVGDGGGAAPGAARCCGVVQRLVPGWYRGRAGTGGGGEKSLDRPTVRTLPTSQSAPVQTAPWHGFSAPAAPGVATRSAGRRLVPPELARSPVLLLPPRAGPGQRPFFRYPCLIFPTDALRRRIIVENGKGGGLPHRARAESRPRTRPGRSTQ